MNSGDDYLFKNKHFKFKLQEIDVSNYWCEISVESPANYDNYEFGYDTRSVVIALGGVFGQPPKFSNVHFYTQDVLASIGDTKTFDCM